MSGPGVLIRPARAGALADWLTLTKPRIGGFVALAALVGALLAGGPEGSVLRACEAALWIALLSAGSCVFNQVLEEDVDRSMRRTAGRPLPSGRLRARDAVLFGAALTAAGVLGLALSFNLLSALLGLSSLVAYVLVYTPLKRLTSLNTVVGALPGAMPPLLGFAAVAGSVHGWGLYLFAVLFVWQFPHFLAIAWLHRADYARAGLRMLPALEGARGMAGRQALIYALVLLPVACLPAVNAMAGPVYLFGALALSGAYAAVALVFALRETPARARALLVTSLVMLPLFLSLVLIDPVVLLATASTAP